MSVHAQLAQMGIPAGALLDPATERLLMASLPTANDLHVAELLTNISTQYRNQSTIWDQVMPVAPVERKRDSFRTYNRGDFLRIEADLRAQNDRGPRGGYRVGTSTYVCKEYSMSTDVTDDERDLASSVDDPDLDATEFCADQVQLKVEQLVSAKVFTAANYPSGNKTTLSGTGQWDDVTSSPISDIDTAKEAVSSECGFEPNTVVMGIEVWRDIKDHPDVVERFWNVERGIITPTMLADLWEVDNIIIGRAIKVTSNEGAASITTARIWGKKVAVLYNPPGGPALKSPAFGYTFVHRATNMLTETWRNGDGATSDAIRTRVALTPEIASSISGYLISDAVA